MPGEVFSDVQGIAFSAAGFVMVLILTALQDSSLFLLLRRLRLLVCSKACVTRLIVCVIR